MTNKRYTRQIRTVRADLLTPGDEIELDEIHYGKWDSRIYKIDGTYSGDTHTTLRLRPYIRSDFDVYTVVRVTPNAATVKVLSRNQDFGFPL